MQAFKFDTRISETGIISLPFENQLFNQEVEIIVLPKVKKNEHDQTKKETATTDFTQKMDDVLITKGLEQLSSSGSSLDFLYDEPDLYSVNDLKIRF
jgi:hypothetical protein